MSDDTEIKELKTSDLLLDLDNPRFFHLSHKSGKTLSQPDIEKEILDNDDDIVLLTRSIQKTGVKDPIWVVRKDDKYLVVEGNRRTVVLKKLIKEGAPPPHGVRFDVVKAHVMPAETPAVDLVLQKARLQSGKKAWGAFNEAALTFQLREHPFLMPAEDIAVHLQIPIAKVKERIENYKIYKQYVEETNDENPKRFSFFAESPAKVKDWINQDDVNKKKYFQLINPLEGKNKIKSVATRGGLRDFAQVLESPEALKFLYEEDAATVEEALDLAKESDVRKAVPFITRIGPLAQDLRSLDSHRVEQLKRDVRVKTQLKSLRAACDEILQKLEE